MRIDDSMSKAEIIRRAKAMAEKFEVIEKRRVAQIDRLIGHAWGDNQTNPAIPPYEHELMQLNEQLGMQDIRIEMLEGALRRIRQSCADKRVAVGNSVLVGPRTDEFLDRLIEWIREVMPDEGPRHMAAGRDTSDLPVLDPAPPPDAY